MYFIICILFSVLLVLLSDIQACTGIFINQHGYHIEGRGMDYHFNIGLTEYYGLIGKENISDLTREPCAINPDKFAAWTNKYGFVAKTAFASKKIVDGLNTEGLSVALLSLPGSKNPLYNPAHDRKVIGVYDVAALLLSQCEDVSNALSLLSSFQIVDSTVETSAGEYTKDIPIHIVISDKQGSRSIIEFREGSVVIHQQAPSVVTNLSKAQCDQQQLDYKETKFPPTDFTPWSRYLRANLFLEDLPTPISTEDAIRQVESILATVTVPKFQRVANATLWTSIKDLDNCVYYTRQIGSFSVNGSYIAHSIPQPCSVVDLKTIDFSGKSLMKDHSIIVISNISESISKMLSLNCEDFQGQDIRTESQTGTNRTA